MSPGLLIVIVNYRNAGLTLDCLASLHDKQSEIPGGFHAIVVENGSGDDSAAALAAAIPRYDWATLVTLKRNLGFAGGNNLALEQLKTRFAGVPYALLLNSDTVVHPGALRHCYDVMQADPTIGVMSCQLLNADGSTQNVTRDFPSPVRQAICSFGLPWVWPAAFGWADIYDIRPQLMQQKRDVDWIGGAFMFLRADALLRIGGAFDPAFFFYGEDIELCYRFHKHGYRVHYDPAVTITHVGGSSSDPTRVDDKLRSVYTWQARYLVQRKCFGRLAATTVRGCDIAAMALRKAKMLITGKRRSDPDRYRNVSDALSLLCRPLRS